MISSKKIKLCRLPEHIHIYLEKPDAKKVTEEKNSFSDFFIYTFSEKLK
jgi:hypothetical protein